MTPYRRTKLIVESITLFIISTLLTFVILYSLLPGDTL